MSYEDSLYHHGINGQKWGRRRFQYEDGSLTPAGKIRYGQGDDKRKRHGDYVDQKSRGSSEGNQNEQGQGRSQSGDQRSNLTLTPYNPKTDRDVDPNNVVQIRPVNTYRTPVEKRDVKSLSDRELKEVIDRIRNESIYNEYFRKKSKVNMETIGKVAKTVGTIATTTMAIYNLKKTLFGDNKNTPATSKVASAVGKKVTATVGKKVTGMDTR